MSASDTKQTSRHAQPMSAFGGKADIGEQMRKQATVHSRLENDSGFVPPAASRRLVRRGIGYKKAVTEWLFSGQTEMGETWTHKHLSFG